MTEGLHRFYGGNDLHFLTFSCYRRLPFFRNEAYCDLFLKILERVRQRYRLVVLGYVVMPEHVHLLVSEPQRETLSTVIQALKLGVVRSIQCSGGGSVVAAAPRSRKTGETWGHFMTPVSGAPASGTRVSISLRIDSGRRAFMTLTFGRKRNGLRNFATFIAIRSRADSVASPSSGAGAVVAGVFAARQVQCGSTTRTSW